MSASVIDIDLTVQVYPTAGDPFVTVSTEQEAAELFGHGSTLHLAVRGHLRRVERERFEAAHQSELTALAQALLGWLP